MTKDLTTSTSRPQNTVPMKDVSQKATECFQELRDIEFGELTIKKHQNVYSFMVSRKTQFVEQ